MAQAFTAAVAKDPYLGVAFYQRGVAHYRAQRFEAALLDFTGALVCLREHPFVDYKQIGLKCVWARTCGRRCMHSLTGPSHPIHPRRRRARLYKCDAHHNRGLALTRLGRHDDARAAYLTAADPALWGTPEHAQYAEPTKVRTHAGGAVASR